MPLFSPLRAIFLNFYAVLLHKKPLWTYDQYVWDHNLKVVCWNFLRPYYPLTVEKQEFASTTDFHYRNWKKHQRIHRRRLRWLQGCQLEGLVAVRRRASAVAHRQNGVGLKRTHSWLWRRNRTQRLLCLLYYRTRHDPFPNWSCTRSPFAGGGGTFAVLNE